MVEFHRQHIDIRERVGHFMSPSMLDSQLAALEAPTHALKLDIVDPPEKLIARIRQELHV